MPIVIRDLTFSYFETSVLRGIDATFDEAKVHLILGRTGSGKTTFALALAGLLKPRRGSVSVDDSEPASGSFDRRLVQLAFQFPETQIFEVTVEREMSYGLRNFGLGLDESRHRCYWALDCVGLARDLLTRDPNGLSFGERRKLALASVIALKPKYLILDEPLAGLDWHGRESLVKAIARLAREGLTTLILTHETDIVGDIGDTVSMPRDGSISGPISVDAFLYSDNRGGDDMLPDYVAIFKNLKARGFAGQGRPRSTAEVYEAVLTALGVRPGGEI